MITEVEMKKLKTHSKKHKGGFESQHIKNMIRIMETNNTSFIAAHKKAVAIDKKAEMEKEKMKKSKKSKQKKY